MPLSPKATNSSGSSLKSYSELLSSQASTPPKMKNIASMSTSGSFNSVPSQSDYGSKDSVSSTQEAAAAAAAFRNHKKPVIPIDHTVRWVTDVSRHYSIGEEVMPSTHRGSKVCYGRRLSDQQDVVIKVRNKKVSFKDEQDIVDWKHNMEIMLNLPESRTFFIARVHDILENQSDFYVIMEAVSGEDLFEFCAREKLYRRNDRLEIARQVALEVFFGLKDLCDLGLIHKDLKLENVVLDAKVDDSPPGTPKKHPKLNAFCKMVDFDTCEEYAPGHRSKDILGTDQYIAPEAYSGFYAPASDVWAIGVMLYKMLTGVFPFHEDIFDDEPGQNYVGHPKMKQIRCRLKLARIDWSHEVFAQDTIARDFVKRCLNYDDKKRISYDGALDHPWLRDEYQDLCTKFQMLHKCRSGQR